MPFLTWDAKTLELKVTSMDIEHQRIITLMNDLYDLNQMKANKENISKKLKELGDFTVNHFAHEENYMKSINYPKLEVHKAVHQQLLLQLNQHVSNFEKSNGILEDSFFGFLSMWLTAHIAHIDMQYSHFVNKKAA